ncbi:resistin-like [Pseudophryne corroboree]|uniref:resistin-like n=1 Tax=Pseudophryne corroboree TaxID=495146 RepID=UPI003081A808
MKLYVSIILLLVPVLVSGNDRHCSLDDSIKSLVSDYCKAPNLQCKYITERSADASCPPGHIVTGCSCGQSCGSWNVVDSTKCHCQCANMDWTTAVCCKTSSP